MNKLQNKKIIVGVTGSIAAYKSALLVRELRKAGAEVNVVMTAAACEFITPLTLGNLSQNPVISEMFDESVQRGGAWHIHLAQNADLMIIAPCTAATLAKLANGLCDNSLVTLATALPQATPLLVAPAMDSTMLLSKATQRNIKQLEEDGVVIIPPAEGELSSGITGPGRLPEIDVLMEYILNNIQ
jgi:phosphopantothenoylcysteine decarboxylase/phosphopantothenate--cysteine ligase